MNVKVTKVVAFGPRLLLMLVELPNGYSKWVRVGHVMFKILRECGVPYASSLRKEIDK